MHVLKNSVRETIKTIEEEEEEEVHEEPSSLMAGQRESISITN